MRKGEQTRERIVQQAAPLFNRQGFAGCSMQDVMDATGLERGGLYRHFASKEELAVEAFRYAMASSVRMRTEKIDTRHGAVEQLRSIVRRFVEAPSAVAGGCPLMNTAIDSDDGNATLRKLACDGFADWRERLEAIVREGIESGEIRRKTEPRRVANAMIAMAEGALMLSRLEGSRMPLEDAEAGLDALFEAISRSEASRKQEKN